MMHTSPNQRHYSDRFSPLTAPKWHVCRALGVTKPQVENMDAVHEN